MPVLREKKDQLKIKFKDIVVIPFDTKGINDNVDKSIKEEIAKAGESAFAPKINDNERFSIRSSNLGMVKGTNIVINDECIADICNDGKVAIEVYSEFYTDDKRTGFSLFPSYTIKPLLNDLINEFALPEIGIVEFMNARFAYNSRIVNNMELLMKEVLLQTKNK